MCFEYVGFQPGIDVVRNESSFASSARYLVVFSILNRRCRRLNVASFCLISNGSFVISFYYDSNTGIFRVHFMLMKRAWWEVLPAVVWDNACLHHTVPNKFLAELHIVEVFSLVFVSPYEGDFFYSSQLRKTLPPAFDRH